MAIKNGLLALLIISAFFSCSIEKQISTKAKNLLIQDSSLLNAHVGIAIQDPSKGEFLYKYQSDKYFTPASNTKIYTSYASLKYLPASLTAAHWTELDTAVFITPTGDPSFLHPDFQNHPLFKELKSTQKPLYMLHSNWNSEAWGSGWSWSDFNEEYMTERNAFPVYGNQIHWYQEKSKKENPTTPTDTVDLFVYSIPDVNWPIDFGKSSTRFQVERKLHNNAFKLFEGAERSAVQSVPFITNGIETGLELLKDSLGKSILIAEESINNKLKDLPRRTIFSQITDSLLKKMMYRSDNFYADMCLIMVAQEKFGMMDEKKIIQYLLQNDLKDLPQKPRWVDGSGLSRYNQFSPEDMIAVLNKMKAELPWERIRTVFPKNNDGIEWLDKSWGEDVVLAKSGSMSGVLCLSGYIKSKKNTWLTFSIMINNHQSSGVLLRKKIETFLGSLNL